MSLRSRSLVGLHLDDEEAVGAIGSRLQVLTEARKLGGLAASPMAGEHLAGGAVGEQDLLSHPMGDAAVSTHGIEIDIQFMLTPAQRGGIEGCVDFFEKVTHVEKENRTPGGEGSMRGRI